MTDRSQIRFALAALGAGLAWGYLRHRHHRAALHSVLQGLEWFIAYGGAAALIAIARQTLDHDEDDAGEPERITHIRQVVTERTGTEG